MTVSFVSLVFGLSSVALGYIPPSSYILKKMVEPHGRVKKVWVQSEVSQLERDGLGAESFQENLIFDSASRTLESRVIRLDGEEIYRTVRNLGYFSETNAEVVGPIEATPIGTQILFALQSSVLGEAMKRRGVPVRTSSELDQMKDATERRESERTGLKRTADGRVAWAIGHQIHSPSAPQFWIEKDLFRAVKWVGKSSNSGTGTTEILFEEWAEFGPFSYPKKITVIVNGEPRYLVQALKVLAEPETIPASRHPRVDGFISQVGEIRPALRTFVSDFYSYVR